MLWTIFILLIILWVLGIVSNFLGGYIHILLIVAVVVIILSFFKRK
ncbi:MAG TPA: lmo0937 family membrane protein [Ignavibacteria bacterium]|nr:lmo0937 family membrane protein [Ignavibacteria bacterium]HAX49439.1 lmo0937 family membrane protein [Bacteroidota bacterium]HRE09713.1 lmo0937 family membrane protein [Ignavibacteria bacterium]HRF65559.1 lmo0937 family membrane protein [Ignavibacteria bacterium]HRJ02945.1 lmo0937 family membrane protein [Ignavibacteria bacterium]